MRDRRTMFRRGGQLCVLFFAIFSALSVPAFAREEQMQSINYVLANTAVIPRVTVFYLIERCDIGEEKYLQKC